MHVVNAGPSNASAFGAEHHSVRITVVACSPVGSAHGDYASQYRSIHQIRGAHPGQVAFRVARHATAFPVQNRGRKDRGELIFLEGF